MMRFLPLLAIAILAVSLAAQNSAAQRQRPAAGGKTPSTGKRPTARTPGTAGKKPGKVAKRSGSTAKRRGSTAKRPGTTGKRPGSTAKRSGSKGKRPGQTAKRSGKTGKRPGKTAKGPPKRIAGHNILPRNRLKNLPNGTHRVNKTHGHNVFANVRNGKLRNMHLKNKNGKVIRSKRKVIGRRRAAADLPRDDLYRVSANAGQTHRLMRGDEETQTDLHHVQDTGGDGQQILFTFTIQFNGQTITLQFTFPASSVDNGGGDDQSGDDQGGDDSGGGDSEDQQASDSSDSLFILDDRLRQRDV